MKKKLFFFIILSIMWACSDDDKKEGGVYDPSKPVEVSEFMPLEGKLREKVIIKGTNFGNDKSKVKVAFIDENSERIATVVGVDNNTIYCMTPRQLPGDNKIKVWVEDKEVVAEGVYNYSQSENVSTISGTTHERKLLDGSLSSARFGRVRGIAAIGDESVIVFCQDDGTGVRLLSVPENKVVTVHTGFAGGIPAVTKDKSTVYVIGRGSPYTIYKYLRSTGWSPSRIGQVGGNTDIISCTLDENEEWLYFIDNQAAFKRFHLQNQTIEIIKNRLDISGTSFNIIYHRLQDCFYVSSPAAFSIYKVQRDGSATLFSGNSNSANSIDGPIEDAQYFSPNGMTVDEDGNIYVIQSGQGHHLLRKIIINENYVSTIAGKKGQNEGQLSGIPLESTFHWPQNVCYDGEGGFWIGEYWGCAVRKYAIE